MAIVALQVANPTAADVTVGSNTAKARRITNLNLDNTTADAYTFMANGCALTSNAGSTFEQHEQQGFLLANEQLDPA